MIPSGSAADEGLTPCPAIWPGTSVLLVVAVVAAAFGGLRRAFAGPQLVTQTRQLETTCCAPSTCRDIPVLGPHLVVEWGVPGGSPPPVVASLPAKIGEQDADLGGLAKGVRFSLGAFCLSAAHRRRCSTAPSGRVDTVRSAIPKPPAGARFTDIGRIVDSVIGRYFHRSLLIAPLNGIWAAIWALVAELRLSPVLAVWASFTSLIPQIMA